MASEARHKARRDADSVGVLNVFAPVGVVLPARGRVEEGLFGERVLKTRRRRGAVDVNRRVGGVLGLHVPRRELHEEGVHGNRDADVEAQTVDPVAREVGPARDLVEKVRARVEFAHGELLHALEPLARGEDLDGPEVVVTAERNAAGVPEPGVRVLKVSVGERVDDDHGVGVSRREGDGGGRGAVHLFRPLFEPGIGDLFLFGPEGVLQMRLPGAELRRRIDDHVVVGREFARHDGLVARHVEPARGKGRDLGSEKTRLIEARNEGSEAPELDRAEATFEIDLRFAPEERAVEVLHEFARIERHARFEDEPRLERRREGFGARETPARHAVLTRSELQGRRGFARDVGDGVVEPHVEEPVDRDFARRSPARSEGGNREAREDERVSKNGIFEVVHEWFGVVCRKRPKSYRGTEEIVSVTSPSTFPLFGNSEWGNARLFRENTPVTPV